MKTFFSVLLFFACNVIGFSVGPILYLLFITSMDVETTQLDVSTAQYNLAMVQFSWLACALFSFAYFFLRGHWKVIYIVCPIIIPALHWLFIMKNYIFTA